MSHLEEIKNLLTAIELLCELKSIVIAEVEKAGHCYNVDFDAIEDLSGAILHCKAQINYHQTEIYFGR